MGAKHSLDQQDIHWMRRAIQLADRARRHPFAALIVDPDAQRVLAEGWNQASDCPIWHGEMVAIDRFFQSDHSESGCPTVLYSTAEPCPMCQAAILWSGIDRVVFGTSIQTLQQLGWNQIEIGSAEVIRRTPFRSCQLVGGILEDECDRLFAAVHDR